MARDNDHLVLAVFDDEHAADEAAEQLKGWDRANEDIKLGSIGVIAIGNEGKIKTRKYGPRNVGRGAKLGAVLGVAVAITPGVNLLGGLVWGAVAGGAVGALSKKGLGMSDQDLQQLSSDLQGGHAALAVLCSPAEVAATTAELERLGGKPKSFEVSDEELQSAQQAIEAAPGAAKGAATAAPEAAEGAAAATTQPAPDA